MNKIKKFKQFINEELDGSTSATVGSGNAVGGGAVGTYTQSAGQAVYGGSSGTAFATNSNTTGMGQIKSAEPSNIPGDVRGSSIGSGDISRGNLGTFTKLPLRRKKGKQRKEKYSEIGADIDNYYKPKYTESTNKNGKLITKWKVFNK